MNNFPFTLNQKHDFFWNIWLINVLRIHEQRKKEGKKAEERRIKKHPFYNSKSRNEL